MMLADKARARGLGGLTIAGWLCLGMAWAEDGTVQRDGLHIVSSGSAHAVTETLAERFAERYEDAGRSRVEIVGSVTALERFCAGIGVDTPDLAVSSRRMPRATLETCRANGVTDVVEVQLGQGAVVLAVQQGSPPARLTTRQVYTALAAELAADETFRPNVLRQWRDVAPGLPDLPISAILPDTRSSTRGLFNDFVLEGGCRGVKALRSIFSSAYRVSKCTTLRTDGRVREVASLDVPAAILASPPGTLGVISYAQLVESGGNLVPLALNGVLPTASSIANHEYLVTRTIYLYAKRQHARATGGIGVVLGVREFLLEAVSEPVGGPGGLLPELAGLVPLSPGARARQQEMASAMRLIER
jgi:phosphate transport system substrate-binding protein